MKKVAVIGSGISGTSAAYYLNKLGYDVYLFESGSYFGGHTNTIDVDFEGQRVSVDTGFLVHNDRTYPNLIDPSHTSMPLMYAVILMLWKFMCKTHPEQMKLFMD